MKKILVSIYLIFLINYSYSQIANGPIEIETCDENNDGLETFDLTSLDSQILGSQDSSTFTISFYLSYMDANNDFNPISTPNNFINTTNPETLYARVTESNTGNYDLTTITIKLIDCTDNDSDGVIDLDEDLNTNGNLNDDDGDNVPTSIEINSTSGRNSNHIHTYIDTDNDLIENYIDNDDDGDGILTVNEDYNNNGDPTDDDTNSNGIPDYLDSGVALSIKSFEADNFKIFPNPSKYLFTIQTPSQITNIYIFMI